jgi:hypothetical protein
MRDVPKIVEKRQRQLPGPSMFAESFSVSVDHPARFAAGLNMEQIDTTCAFVPANRTG